MRKHFIFTAAALCIALLAQACTNDATIAPSAARTTTKLGGRLLLSGSTTMGPMLNDIGERFHALHPDVGVEVRLVGTTRGISDVRDGSADIGMASRALTGKDGELFGFPMARDGVALIVHKDNRVQSLSDKQVIDIYTGKITNWKAVGGRDATIVVISRTAAGTALDLFTNYFKLAPADIRAQAKIPENAAAMQAVAAQPDSVTFGSIGDAERRALLGEAIKLLPLGGVAATTENVRRGNYAISRALTLLTNKLPTGLTKAFIEFSLSPQVSGIVQAHDFIAYQD